MEPWTKQLALMGRGELMQAWVISTLVEVAQGILGRAPFPVPSEEEWESSTGDTAKARRLLHLTALLHGGKS